MSTPSTDTPASPLSTLAPRKVLDATLITAMIGEMKDALRGAYALDFFKRMEHNHDFRHCWWPGQTRDGRKWPTERSRSQPGSVPDEIFPWPGASDTRVRLIDTVIRERNTLKRLALQRRQERIGPRDLSPDDDPQAKAALWGQVSNYFEDLTRWEFRTACAQWSNIAEEYGHGVLYTGWHTDKQLTDREIMADDLVTLVTNTALRVAQESMAAQHLELGGDPEQLPELAPDQKAAIMQDAATRLADIIADDKRRAVLVQMLMAFDEDMPKSEAIRVASQLKLGAPVSYHATTPINESPEWRALTPFIDVFYPPTTTRLPQAAWICMTEWVGEAELKSRIETEDYSEPWVKAVLEKPGRSIDLTGTDITNCAWLLSSGSVRCGVRATDPFEKTNNKLFQILHIYYRSTAIGGTRALYHTVLHGQVDNLAGLHECCEHAHGEYPFIESLTEVDAPYLLASHGAGELTDTYQTEVKIQRDLKADNASITIRPPVKVPINQAGGRIEIRPGVQIPMRTTSGMGMFETMNIGVDPKASMEVEATTMDSFNEFWARGAKVDPEIKAAVRQMLVSDFLEDVRRVKIMSFQLIQQFAPDELRASFIGGLPVDMHVTREEIQGQVSLEIDFDVSDLSPDLVTKRMEAITALFGMDNAGLLQRPPILKALTAWLLPSHYKGLVADPREQARSEADAEQNIAAQIVSGTQYDEQSSYIPGGDHATRLQVLQNIFGFKVDDQGTVVSMTPLGKDGQPTRAQRIFSEDPDVNARIANRLKFHTFQLKQQTNAITGKTGVEPITGQEAA